MRTTPTIDRDRLASITRLDGDSHASPDEGMCVMEAVAYVTGEPFTDNPACACPVITTYAICVSDWMNGVHRQRLLPYIARIAGSRADVDTERRRAYIAADYAVRVFAPLALAAVGRSEDAAEWRAIPPVIDAATAAAAVYIADGSAIGGSAELAAMDAAEAVAGDDPIGAASNAAYTVHVAAMLVIDPATAWDAALACLDAMLDATHEG